MNNICKECKGGENGCLMKDESLIDCDFAESMEEVFEAAYEKGFISGRLDELNAELIALNDLRSEMSADNLNDLIASVNESIDGMHIYAGKTFKELVEEVE